VEKVQEVRRDDKMEVSYMMWQLKFQDAVEEGRAEGRMEGRAEGRTEGKIEGRIEGREEMLLFSIKNLIKNTGWPLEQAMQTLGVPQEKWPQYSQLIADP